MSAVSRRMNSLKELTTLRTGPGAAILPKTVTKIHLEFAHKFEKGHEGSRKFWQKHLTSLKYYNPDIPMIVNRTYDQRITPTLTIYMTGASAAAQAKTPSLETPSAQAIKAPKKPVANVTDQWQYIESSTTGTTPAPEAGPGETAVKINLKKVPVQDIWKEFVQKTGATPVEPSAADVHELERIAVGKAQAKVDRLRQQAINDKLQEEKQTLEKARQEADAVKAD